MKKFIYLVLMLLSTASFAQNANLLVIHNSPDPNLENVDVYANGLNALQGFKFRQNSPIVSLPAGMTSIDIKDNPSTMSDLSLLSDNLSTQQNTNYVVMAVGVADSSQFAPNPDGKDISAQLLTIANTQIAASNPSLVAFNVVHASPDAPTVDIRIRNTNLLLNNVAYLDHSPYIEVDPAEYLIDIYDSTGNNLVATFAADLRTLGGSAVTVYASGFFNPSANNNGEAFGLYVAIPQMGMTANGLALSAVTTAELQVIHNAADRAASEVDLYLNGNALTDLNPFSFRTASAFLELPANQDLQIGIAPANSASANEIIASFDVNLVPGEKYQAIANGVLTPNDFSANPDNASIAFDLWTRQVIDFEDATNVELSVIHGATDVPTVNVAARGAGTLISSIGYGNIDEKIAVAPSEYTLDLLDKAGTTVLKTYSADLSSISPGTQISIVASGFLSPDANNNGESFALLAVLADGTVLTLDELNTAKVQIIHNAADPNASFVDIYLNGDLAINNFAFRSATAYLDLPANQDITIGVADSSSTSSTDAIAVFDLRLLALENYVVVANGVLNPTDFEANPDNISTAFNLFVNNRARTEAVGENDIDLMVFHGITDAPTVNVYENLLDITVVDNLSYGAFSPYVSLVEANYSIQLRVDANNQVLRTVEANLNGLGGNSAVILASGFVDTDNANQSGVAYSIYAALPGGGPLVLFDTKVSVEDLPNPSPSIDVFPNPSAEQLFINSVEKGVIEIYNINGQLVFSESISEGIQKVNINSLKTGSYIVKINGQTAQHIQRIIKK